MRRESRFPVRGRPDPRNEPPFEIGVAGAGTLFSRSRRVRNRDFRAGQERGIVVRVELPELGESVLEGTVSQWLVREGDRVDVDQPLVEVTTDKVDAEIPSPVAGVISQILVAEGAQAKGCGAGDEDSSVVVQRAMLHAEVSFPRAERRALV